MDKADDLEISTPSVLGNWLYVTLCIDDKEVDVAINMNDIILILRNQENGNANVTLTTSNEVKTMHCFEEIIGLL